MTPPLVVIYGAGGFGREVAWLARLCSIDGARVEVACFVDDDAGRQGSRLNGVPVLSLEDAKRAYPRARMVSGVGDPATRARLTAKAVASGYDFCTLIHPRVERSEWVEIGVGSVICGGTFLTTNVTIGRHVQVNLQCTIGHDTRLDDFATLAPGVHISGWVHLEEGAYLGTGASVVNGTAQAPLVIGKGAVVGAGACVVKTVPPGLTVWGVPARPLRSADTVPG